MITLYSDPHCPNSHRTRIVLAEKELPVTTIELDADNLPADFLKLNPYGKLPTVIDRDIVFFESSVVNEYLDERYPHPPLKPGSPAERAQMRLAVMQLERELFPIYADTKNPRKKKDAVKKLGIYMVDSYDMCNSNEQAIQFQSDRMKTDQALPVSIFIQKG